MTLSQRQVETLYRMLSLTKSEELTCDECLKRMAEFAENALAGDAIPENLQAIEHHLALCGECEEEFRALMDALESDR